MAFDIGVIFTQWEMAGVFEFLLPFLLIFAIVFGILTTTNIISKQKGLHVIIAVIIGLMSVWAFNSLGFTLGQFLMELFPRFAVGISVILVLMILIGLFITDEHRKYWFWGLGAIGFIVAIIVITQTFDRFTGFSFGSNYGEYVGWIIGAVLLLGLIIAVAASGGGGGGGGGTPGAVSATFTPIR